MHNTTWISIHLTKTKKFYFFLCHLLRLPFLTFLLFFDTFTSSLFLFGFSDSWYMWSSFFCMIWVVGWDDTIIQSSTKRQLFGLYRLSIEHICSTGQLRQGADSIQSILTGSLVGRSLYDQRPFSKNFTLLISDRFSSEIATREPSRLLRSNSFQSLDWIIPSLPLFVIILRLFPARSSISAHFPIKESTSIMISLNSYLIIIRFALNKQNFKSFRRSCRNTQIVHD